MTDKSTIEQIIDHALTKGVTIGRITVDEILAIAIKSPEAAEYYKPVIESLKFLLALKSYKNVYGKDRFYNDMMTDAWQRAKQAIESLNKVQSDE